MTGPIEAASPGRVATARRTPCDADRALQQATKAPLWRSGLAVARLARAAASLGSHAQRTPVQIHTQPTEIRSTQRGPPLRALSIPASAGRSGSPPQSLGLPQNPTESPREAKWRKCEAPKRISQWPREATFTLSMPCVSSHSLRSFCFIFRSSIRARSTLSQGTARLPFSFSSSSAVF